MIKTVIVDDEQIAIKNLNSLIGKYCPMLDVKATASTVDAALDTIASVRPELVLMDIELSGQNSFEILQQYEDRDFEVIFVTAYDEYGIQAVKQRAADYILKPIDKTELIRAVSMVHERINNKQANAATIKQAPISKLALPGMDSIVFVDTDKIIYCESDGRYTRFYIDEGNDKILVSKNLGEYELLLPPDMFIRIHHHCIVNLKYVVKYIKGRGGYVVMKNGNTLEVSSRKKDMFLHRMNIDYKH